VGSNVKVGILHLGKTALIFDKLLKKALIMDMPSSWKVQDDAPVQLRLSDRADQDVLVSKVKCLSIPSALFV
jgi:hypothetical protein